MEHSNSKSKKMRFIDIMCAIHTRQGSRAPEGGSKDTAQGGAQNPLESEISMNKEGDVERSAWDDVILISDCRRVRMD
jgi:hypothetical protein